MNALSHLMLLVGSQKSFLSHARLFMQLISPINELAFIIIYIHWVLLTLAVGGTTPDNHDRLHGLRHKGWSSPQDEDLRCTVLLGIYRKTSRAIS